jgi:hypothetical protein
LVADDNNIEAPLSSSKTLPIIIKATGSSYSCIH